VAGDGITRLPSPYLDTVRERVVFFDGAMGTSIQGYDLTAEDFGGKEGCNENLIFCNPGIIEGIHASYLETGVDVLEAEYVGQERAIAIGVGAENNDMGTVDHAHRMPDPRALCDCTDRQF